MTEREVLFKRYLDAGGTWPLPRTHVRPWPGSGRYAPVKCAECGQAQRPMTSTCALCGEDLRP